MYCLFSVLDVHLLFLSYVNLVGRTVGFFKEVLGVVILLGPSDFGLCGLEGMFRGRNRAEQQLGTWRGLSEHRRVGVVSL